MTRNDKAILFAKKLAEFWQAENKIKAERGKNEYDLEWMLSNAWLRGFDAGQLHQRKITKAKQGGHP